MSADEPVIFTPDNEPYRGRELLFHYDQMILSCMEANSKIAPRTHIENLNEFQKMAAIVIPQAISIALSIRELIRQGYLFGAENLVRPFVERAIILQYLQNFPQEIEKWQKGWKHNEAPSLGKMFEQIWKKTDCKQELKGHEFTCQMNSIMHGKPDSIHWNLVETKDGKFGLAPSKILNKPNQCDELCAFIIPWFAVVQAMMNFYFPENKNDC
jgi:hypothetical protein